MFAGNRGCTGDRVAQVLACGGWSEHGRPCCHKTPQAEACATQIVPRLRSGAFMFCLSEKRALESRVNHVDERVAVQDSLAPDHIQVRERFRGDCFFEGLPGRL